MEEKLSVFGLGKLGCTMLACFAHKGWQVIGMDVNVQSVQKINDGISPIYEPGVEALLRANRIRIKATTDPVEAILGSDVSYIIVPTPSRRDGSFSTEFVEMVIQKIGQALRQKDTYHLVVVTSTVMPGETERMKDMLEDISGKTCGESFGVCFNPDFIALGKIVHDFLNPDMILIGESDQRAGDLLEGIHSRLVDSHPEYHRMSFHNAELAKIGLNSYCVMKISFANVIGEICEKMPTGDADKVLAAIGSDSRVGKKYFRPGLAAAGPCFPRDSRAFRVTARDLGITHTFSEVADDINNYHKSNRIPLLLQSILKEKYSNKISILGLSYKEDINVIDESVSVEVAKQLAGMGLSVRVFDPASNNAAKEALKDYPQVVFACSALECIRGTDLCFIGTPWQEFKAITADDFVREMGKYPTVFDSWGIYKGTDVEASLDYRKVGRLNTGIESLIPMLAVE